MTLRQRQRSSPELTADISMNSPKYYVIAESRDSCELPTTPEPIEPEQVGDNIADFLAARRSQGYFLNCNGERIPLDELAFRVVPADTLE